MDTQTLIILGIIIAGVAFFIYKKKSAASTADIAPPAAPVIALDANGNPVKSTPMRKVQVDNANTAEP